MIYEQMLQSAKWKTLPQYCGNRYTIYRIAQLLGRENIGETFNLKEWWGNIWRIFI